MESYTRNLYGVCGKEGGTVEDFKNIIIELADLFSQNSIEYHFDGSTALFLQNRTNSMNDIDIVFPYENINDVKKVFENEIILGEKYHEDIGMYEFSYIRNDIKIHSLFYNEEISSFYDYHRKISSEGNSIWVKGYEHFEESE